MLQLSASEWGNLRHAHGSAHDVPEDIQRLAQARPLPRRWRDEPLFSLWDKLCHQGCPDEAAYAAVPHLVHICETRNATERRWVMNLVGSIAANKSRGAAVPHWLSEDFAAGLESAASIAYGDLLSTKSSAHRLDCAATLAAARGFDDFARALSRIPDEEIDAKCPGCGVRLTLGTGGEGFALDPWAWKRRPGLPEKRGAVPEMASMTEPVAPTFAQLAVELDEPVLARQFADLAGLVACSECARTFELLEAISRAYP